MGLGQAVSTRGKVLGLKAFLLQCFVLFHRSIPSRPDPCYKCSNMRIRPKLVLISVGPLLLLVLFSCSHEPSFETPHGDSGIHRPPKPGLQNDGYTHPNPHPDARPSPEPAASPAHNSDSELDQITVLWPHHNEAPNPGLSYRAHLEHVSAPGPKAQLSLISNCHPEQSLSPRVDHRLTPEPDVHRQIHNPQHQSTIHQIMKTKATPGPVPNLTAHQPLQQTVCSPDRLSTTLHRTKATYAQCCATLAQLYKHSLASDCTAYTPQHCQPMEAGSLSWVGLCEPHPGNRTVLKTTVLLYGSGFNVQEYRNLCLLATLARFGLSDGVVPVLGLHWCPNGGPFLQDVGFVPKQSPSPSTASPTQSTSTNPGDILPDSSPLARKRTLLEARSLVPWPMAFLAFPYVAPVYPFRPLYGPRTQRALAVHAPRLIFECAWLVALAAEHVHLHMGGDVWWKHWHVTEVWHSARIHNWTHAYPTLILFHNNFSN